MEIFFKSLFNLEGIAPEKPHRATFEAKVGVIENVIWKFKKFDIAIPFHQYSNSIEKHFGKEKKIQLWSLSCWQPRDRAPPSVRPTELF